MRGEIELLYRVTCGVPGCYVELELEHKTMTAVHRDLWLRGWKRLSMYNWICPECVKRVKENNHE
jgi:hypothetical protein